MSVKIYTMTHKSFDVPPDDTYVPLHVGAEGKSELGYLKDNSGDNISSLNPYFAELSGMYWVWKNVDDVDNVGICHYRRYLVNEQNQGMSAPEYESLLKKYDLITSRQLELPNPYYYGFEKNHNIRDLDLVGEAIKEIHPEDYDIYNETVHGVMTYFGNIMVAKKELYDEYCEWLFPIFFKVHDQIGAELDSYDGYHKRVYGFISEILLLVWVKARKLNPYECKVGMLGEKKETVELKSKLADYFKNHDIDNAQRYFEAVLKERPDVTMEASDITGELKICMQIIATYRYEQSSTDMTFIDYVDDYAELIKLFTNINKTVIYILKNPDKAGTTINQISGNSSEFMRVASLRGIDFADMYNGYAPSKEALYVSVKMNEGIYK